MSLITKSNQLGVGLIETMVSLLILGVGMLGVLSLQANGLSSNQRATFSTEAQVLAQDMVDRILGYGNDAFNAEGAGYIAGTFTTPTTQAAVDGLNPGCLATGGCDADATVTLDQYQWSLAVLNSHLPSGMGEVAWQDPFYRVRVYWDQDRRGASGIPDSCTDNTNKVENLSCFELQVRP